jgi:Leucine-rich repeat (LRR) protein
LSKTVSLVKAFALTFHKMLTLLFLLVTTIPYLESLQNSKLHLEELTGILSSSIFPPSTNPKELYISASSVYKIENGALCTPSLERIHLEDNSFPKLTKHSFGNCPFLKTLALVHNYGLKFSVDTFSNFPNLTELAFVEQSVPHVTRELFRNLTSLKRLSIICAGVEKIGEGAFSDLKNLEVLSLGENALKTLDGVLTPNLHKLRMLLLDYNNLETFPWSDLENVKNLEYLALSNNKISHVDAKKVSRLAKLRSFDLSSNPLQPQTVDCVRQMLNSSVVSV